MESYSKILEHINKLNDPSLKHEWHAVSVLMLKYYNFSFVDIDCEATIFAEFGKDTQLVLKTLCRVGHEGGVVCKPMQVQAK